jgi:hypothetical protein
MESPTEDRDAWEIWPHHRKWFDKLWFSLQQGYRCGPTGVAPSTDGYYVVRPIYNLSGMGVGARKQYISTGDRTKVEPGYFWCEWFDGAQHSVTYEWDKKWVPVSSWHGVLKPKSLTRFLKWQKSSFMPELPAHFDVLQDVGLINVEFIGNNPIEVHLRPSPDPHEYAEYIPVWADESIPHDNPMWVESFDNADGFLDTARIGFIAVINTDTIEEYLTD